jgi:hypothetical protein
LGDSQIVLKVCAHPAKVSIAIEIDSQKIPSGVANQPVKTIAID